MDGYVRSLYSRYSISLGLLYNTTYMQKLHTEAYIRNGMWGACA